MSILSLINADEKYSTKPFRLNRGSNIILITLPTEIIPAKLYQTSSSRFTTEKTLKTQFIFI